MAKTKVDYWLTKDGLTLLEAWARDGLNDKEIASKMNIATSTLSEYKVKHDSISDALAKGKEIVDIFVENALYKRAIGYEYDEIKEKYECGILVERIITKKAVIPDTGAQAMWLKNRKPNVWREKQEVQQSIEFVDDGFINALKEKANDINEEGVDFVEE
jgi:hypothetical protein